MKAKKGYKILIFSETCPEWLLTAFAAFQHGLPLVTLLPTLSEEGLKHAINESEVEIIVISQELISKFEVKEKFFFYKHYKILLFY